jgi:pyrimidine operon attenuation protein/uracil phosphoribosyltransferase
MTTTNNPPRRLILDAAKLHIITQRLCHQALENHDDFAQSVVVGLQPRGLLFAQKIHETLQNIVGKSVNYGVLDTTFHRDDFRRTNKILVPNATTMNIDIENKKVILIDDVLFTGRTVRAGFDALLDFGRPQKVELLVLINRRYARHFPIEPDYCGLMVDTLDTQRINADFVQNEIWLELN